MKILVANLGSTSFKYRLFDMDTEQQLARGGAERIGTQASRVFAEMGGERTESVVPLSDHAAALQQGLAALTDAQSGCLTGTSEVAAIGFKAVHAERAAPVERVTDDLIRRMEAMNRVAPAHNPPYVTAMKLLRKSVPDIPLIAAFETGFHATIPERARAYAVPHAWAEDYGVRRWGFHGASHRFIGHRIDQLLKDHRAVDGLRVISCHLGGSSSLCAMRGGKSVATSLGMSPQSGIPHNNRVGDFDPFALPVLMRKSGRSLAQLLDDLASRSGLLGLSGISGDVRDLQHAAGEGQSRARLALDAFVTAVRNYLGAYLVELAGADVIVFTGGIGENSPSVRQAVCRDLSCLGIAIDAAANAGASGEACISAAESRVAVWVVPTNEEIVVARQVKAYLEG